MLETIRVQSGRVLSEMKMERNVMLRLGTDNRKSFKGCKKGW